MIIQYKFFIMCDSCGCHEASNAKNTDRRDVYNLETDILSENNRLALFNRGWLQARNIFAINLVSSPGSGKTSILESTIKILQSRCEIAVIEGDQQTDNDANRIKALGIKAHQINTESGCHLDAHMVIHALEELNPVNGTLLFIENVGNLVCPAMFDLGENMRVVVISVTEGDDKPLKYPYMFTQSDICIINKIDLLPYVPCDIYTLKENCIKVNPKLKLFEMSATTGNGMDIWCDFLFEHLMSIHENKGIKQESFFDKMAVEWDNRTHHDSSKIETILSKLNIKKGSKILDIGTGTGILIPNLASAAGSEGEVVAVDMSPKMIAVAKEKYGLLKNVVFEIADIETIQPAGTFDYIILYSVYPHLKRPVDTVCSLIKHHLARNGNLIIAHSQGREAINSMHHNLEDNVESLKLPAVEELCDQFESRGVRVVGMVDNDNLYYIILANKNE